MDRKALQVHFNMDRGPQASPPVTPSASALLRHDCRAATSLASLKPVALERLRKQTKWQLIHSQATNLVGKEILGLQAPSTSASVDHQRIMASLIGRE